MKNRKILNDYFLKKAKSKINLTKRKNKIPLNKSNNTKKIFDLYKEDMNYNIESTKTMESNQRNDESISLYNKNSMTIKKPKNLHQFNTININKSDSCVRNLENKIKERNNQLTRFIEYRNTCEMDLKPLIHEEILPLTIDSLKTNYYTNRSERKIKNISKAVSTSRSHKNIHFIAKNNNNGKTLELNSYNSDENIYKTKYLSLLRRLI